MASIVDTSVKHAYSSMTGASVITGTTGSLIAALKAFLVTGWGAKAVDSAVISNGVCRLTFASGKSAAEFHSVITVSGASPSGLNGEQRVTAVANGWVEFKTDLPDGAVTGSINFKMAALGWEEVFSKTNVSVFRPADMQGTRPFFRIDDSNAQYARVTMYESMTDVDNGLAMSPQSVPGGYYWYRRSNTTACYWMLIGDGRGFHFALTTNSTNALTTGGYSGVTTFAGDLVSARSGDAWCGTLTGSPTSGASDVSGCLFQSGASAGMTLQRLSSGLGGSVQTNRALLGVAASQSGADSYLGAFPSRADNGLRLSPIYLIDGAGMTNGPRGAVPGAFHCPQTLLQAAFGSDVRFTKGEGVFAGKQLLSYGIGNPFSTNQGVAVFDATGPWR